MPYYSYQSKWSEVPFSGSKVYTLGPLPDAQIVNWGWQNEGKAASLWASQIFVYDDASSAYMQLVNTSLSATNVCARWTLYVADGVARPDVTVTATVVETT